MKKSTIWLLVLIMAATFAGLLYLQISYMDDIVKIRQEQFSEIVKRCLWSVSRSLEKEETKKYLIEDLQDQIRYNKEIDNEIAGYGSSNSSPIDTTQSIAKPRTNLSEKHGKNAITISFQEIQEALERRVLYQRSILDDLILEMLRTSNTRPITERVDLRKAEMYLRQELQNNGLNIPFQTAISNTEGSIIVKSPDYLPKNKVNLFSQQLFPNDNSSYTLDIYFPTRPNYIYSTMKFFIPSFIFTLVLLVTFLFTIITAFRQKRLTEMKTDFINNMTHEFKTPIATISLASQMLKDGAVTNTPETIDRVATIIRDESKRLTFQVERVLQTALFTETRMKLKLKNININQLIEDLLPKFSLRVEDKGGKFSAYLEADQDEVLADEVHVTNVISNLVDNAIKYCVKPPEITIYTRNKDKEIIISVIDNGIGIAKKDQKLIFERFYRVSTGNLHDVKGFGLGLSYVKKIVEAHGGRIDVESSLEKGSCFDIILPLTVKKQKIKRTLFF